MTLATCSPPAVQQPLPSNNSSAPAEDDVCFICLDGSQSSKELGTLGRHCNCPALFSHRSCLLRWQLQNAGKAEEKQCRFCKSQLSDWRSAISEVQPTDSKKPAIMAVVFQGRTVKVPVVTGPEGVAEFKKTVCKLFNLPEGTDFEVTFECKSPVFGDKLHLKGFDCFEAASYCAAVSAAKRANHKSSSARPSLDTGTSSAPATPTGASSGFFTSPFHTQHDLNGRNSGVSLDDNSRPLSHRHSAGDRAGRHGPSPLGNASNMGDRQRNATNATTFLQRVRAGIRCCSSVRNRSSDGGADTSAQAPAQQPPAVQQARLPTTNSAPLAAAPRSQESMASTGSLGSSPSSHDSTAVHATMNNSHGTGPKPSSPIGSTISSFFKRVL